MNSQYYNVSYAAFENHVLFPLSKYRHKIKKTLMINQSTVNPASENKA